MNTALAILAHALRMLMFQTSTTLRVLMPAMLLVLGCSIAITVFAPDMLALLQQPPAQMTTASPRSALAFVVIGVVGLMGYALMAIMWHRHVLLNGPERDARRTPSPGIFLAYLGRAIAVGCLQFIAALPVYLLMGGLLASVSPDATNSMMETVLSLLVSWLLIWIALRFSVVLPAAALGRRMTVNQSWTLTKPVARELWGVALLLMGLNLLIYEVAHIALPDTGALTLVLNTALFILEGLVFASVLTTLYGHLFEGRSLGQ
jgi:hypothetical protein